MNLANHNPSADDKHVFDAQLEPGANKTEFFDTNKLSTQTEFFRMSSLYNDLQEVIVPELVKQKQKTHTPIRIWSAGCSDGREPYSLALLFRRQLDRVYKVNPPAVSIRASDVAPSQIAVARSGQYLMKNSDQKKLEVYKDYVNLSDNSNTVEISKNIKRMISFNVEDISKHEYRQGYDIIICSHVLLYYEKQYAEKIIKHILNSLTKTGYVYFEPANLKVLRSLNYQKIRPGSHFFRAGIN